MTQRRIKPAIASQARPTSDEESDLARQTLAAAVEAFSGGLLDNARDYLSTLDFRALAIPERYRAQNLLEELGDAAPRRDLEKEYSQELESDDPLTALQLARRLADATSDPREKNIWRQRRARLGERIGKSCGLEVSTERASLEDCLKLGFYYQRSHLWLSDDGRRLVIVNTFDDWLFIRWIDAERSEVMARVSLRPPRPLVRPLTTCLDGDRLWITGARGGMLELRPDTWRILGWYTPEEFIPDDYTVEATVPFPGGTHLWMEVRSPDDEPETLVIDLEAWRVERKLPGGLVSLIPLAGPGPRRVVYSSDELGTRVYTERGTLPGAECVLSHGASTAAVSPDGNGILFMVGRAVWQVEMGRLPADAPEVKDRLKDKGEMLVLIEETASGASRVAAELDLGTTLPLGDRRLATSTEEGLCFVLVTRDRFEEEILAISPRETGFEILYRFRVPYGAMLLSDRHARRAMALIFSHGRVQLLPLGCEKPIGALEPAAETNPDSHLPSVTGSHLCGAPTGDARSGIEHLAGPLEEAGYEELELMIEEFEKQEADIEIEHLVFLCLALRKTSYMVRDRLDRYIKRLAGRHPSHAGIALLRAEAAAEKEDWQEVGRRLIELEPQGLDDGRRRHFFHLKGLALLHAKEPAKAYQAFENATLHEQGDCDLQALRQLTRPMGNPPSGDEWGPDQPRIRQILGALLTVDRQVLAGQLEEARALLETPHLWQISEQQLTARLASIYLDTPVSTPTERFYKRLALARFCFILGLDERFFRKELVLPGLTWERSRLEELESQIRTWFDRESFRREQDGSGHENPQNDVDQDARKGR